MASHQYGQCCCDCPTKVDTGLPDSIVTSFNILESSDDGMPSDEILGTCDGGDWYYRFSYNPAIVNLLSSIIYDYIGSSTSTSCGTCCFLYEGRSDYEICEGADEAIYIGSSPFHPYAIADQVSEELWIGNSTNGAFARSGQPYPHNDTDTLPTEPCNTLIESVRVDWCCSGGWHWAADFETCEPEGDSSVDYICSEQTTEGCQFTCGDIITWFGGTAYLPKTISATSTMMVCVDGEVVTICITLNLLNECVTKSGGDGQEYGPHETGCSEFGGECAREDEWTDTYSGMNPSAIEDCTSSAATILLAATADLTSTPGADIWEKIKAYDWESEFESNMCNCGGGGCVDSFERIVSECEINILCSCLGTDEAEHITDSDYPIDIECYYAVGTLGLGFNDE